MTKRKPRKTTARKTTRRPGRPLPGWVWMLTGLIIGLSATFLPSFNPWQAINTEKNPDSNSQAKVAKTNRTFDFYTLLPELEIVVDKNGQTPADTPDKKLPASRYVLQVGSFKNHQEADSLKAQLALMGVETNIEKVTVNTVNWHRVRVGPSKHTEQLESVQKRLRANKIDSILFKVRN